MTTIDTGRQPTIAAFGEWSETNIGDHAIHEGVQAFFGDCGWRVRSFDFGALRPAAGAPSRPSEHRRGRLWPALTIMPVAKRALRGLRQQFLMKQLLPELAGCDAICVGGGALLTDINLHFPQSLEALTWAARQLDKPLLCLGCSVEEDWSPRGRRIVHDFLASCGFVAVRDHASAARVSRLLGRDVPIFGDFALRLTTTGDAAHRGPRRYVLAVNVTHVPAPHSASQARYEDGLVDVVTKLVAQRPGAGGIAIFTTGSAQDSEPANRVWRRLAPYGAELHLGQSLPALRELLRSSRVVVAARLHAAIIALAEQLPVLGYAATPKVGHFLETVGLRACYFSPTDPTTVVVNQLWRLMSPPQQITVVPNASFDPARQRAREFLFLLTQPVNSPEAVNL